MIVSAEVMSVTIFVVIMQIWVSVAIMQVVLSAEYYAHDFFYCNYAGEYKGIISSLYFSTFVNSLPELRYFEGRN